MSQSHPRSTQTSGIHTRSATFAMQIINAVQQQVTILTNEEYTGGSNTVENISCLFHQMIANYGAIEWSWDSYSDAGWFTFGIAGCNCDIYYDPEIELPVEHKIDVNLLADELVMDTDTAGFVIGNIHALFIVLEELFNPTT